MSEYDRGGGPPHDEPLAFDRRERPTARGPAPLTLILSVLLLLILAGVIFAVYRGGLSEGARSPRLVGSPVGDLHAPPAQGAGDVDPAAGLKIYQQAEGEPPPLQPNFTPPPEQPLPRPAAPAAAPDAAPDATTSGAVAPPVSPPPAPVTVLTKPPAASSAAAPPKSTPPPKPLAAKPGETPSTKAPKAETASAKTAADKPATGAAAVQIGAFSSAELADKEWSAAVARAGGAGRGKRVEKVERDGSTLFRTTVTGFPDRAAAQAFCERLKAAGKSCFVR